MSNSTLQQIPTREIFSFHGGVHPEEHKLISNQTAIRKAAIAPYLIVPTQQHIGQAAEPCVTTGERVLKGQVIATAKGLISANIHAPSSGTVMAIEDRVVPHPSGLSDTCIVIETDGLDEWVALNPCENYLSLEPQDIVDRVRSAGITGMGGAGFPTAVKIHPPSYDKVETLILNAAECEPYITADDRLMRERADEVIKGMELMAYVLQPGECLIGIEDNKPEAIEALKRAAQETRIEVVVLPTKYPSGGEKQLIQLLTNKEVPSGKIPADIGVVCQNVGTAAAVYRAVRFGEPLISRITTLTGEQIGQPGNVDVLLGTPIKWLLEQYAYQATRPERVIMGGPMMGFSLSELDIPVVKSTNCILAPSLSEMPTQDMAQACIRCGLCAEACPAELLPQQLYWFSRAEEYEKAEHHNLFDCIECGACAYVCPSSIPLVQYYRHAKGEIRQQQADHAKSDRARIRFEARQARLEREAAEKEAKRKARAEAAAAAMSAKQAAAEAAPASDDKKAAIEAALARKKATPQAEPSEQNPEALKTAWDKAQEKLDKMLDALETAKQQNPEQVEKLSRAVEKNQMRVNQAKQAYEKALATSQTSASTPELAPVADESVDIESLESAWNKAQAKLDKMQAQLDDAKANQPELVEKLERAVEKNKTRTEAAKQAFDQAKAAESPRNLVSEEEIKILEDNVDKAKAKLEKMQAQLAEADADLAEKLSRAVEKNKVRVRAAEQALADAQAQASAGE